MYDNEFFVVDMANCSSTGEIINNLSLALETLNSSGKKIVLKLNDGYLNQSQLLSIQSLITSWGCTLDTIETVNQQTRQNAESMNIYVQEPIETRLKEKYPQDNFDNLNLNYNEQKQDSNIENDNIVVKESDGNRFEADLDAIQKQQEAITQDIETTQYGVSEDFQVKDEKSVSDFIKEPEPAFSNQAALEENFFPKEENEETQNPDNDGLKNSLGVYKKAYDENLQTNDFEEVDFYESPTDEPVVSDTKTTTYINQTLRSGQILESEGNVVVIGDCHPGSEIRAQGDITVWGVLSGIAHAGYKGNTDARVRALKLNPVQIRIGNCYSRRPDGTNIPYIIRSSVFTPEEARVVDGEIMLFKINQN